MQEQVVLLLELFRLRTGLCLSELHCPLTSFLVPVAADHFCVESHVFPKVESLANFVEVFEDFRGMTVKFRPVWT